MIKLIDLGSDPEFAIVDVSGNLIASTEIIPGHKSTPYTIEDGFSVLRDNVLVEANIPPSKTKEGFISNMEKAKELIKSNFLDNLKYDLKFIDSGEYSDHELSHPEAYEFGCEPHMNAWSGTEERSSFNGSNMRTLGMHLHIGYEFDDLDIPKELFNPVISKACDLFIAIPARIHFNDEFRNSNYGDLGSFRNKKYGLEYRSLGGHFADVKYLSWIYDQIVKVFDFINDFERISLINSLTKEEVENLFNDQSGYENLGIEINDQLINIEIEECAEYSDGVEVM